MGPVSRAIRDKLTAALAPTVLEIDDQSAKHAGHAGAREGGESHFHVTVESAAFAGQSAVMRQRRVHRALEDELKGPVHALSLTLRAPGETSGR
jgi:BolA family transcriptional regulator, general stress-responsive regulator